MLFLKQGAKAALFVLILAALLFGTGAYSGRSRPRCCFGRPYRFIRHPGYVGMLLFSIATPLVLGSLWAFGAVGLNVLVVLVRTALEDRMLLRELPGYDAYARRVPARLLPGVW